MKVFPKRLTDDELVDRLKSRLGLYRRMRWWLTILYAFIAVCHIALFLSISKVLTGSWADVDLDDAQAPFYIGSFAGAFLGLGLGFSLSSVIAGLTHYLGDCRIAKLLTQHYPSSGSVAP